MSQTNTKAYSQDELQKMIAQLQAENEALKAKKAAKAGGTVTSNGLSLRVSEKKALSIYGLARFPITVYVEQLLRIVEAMPEILAFIEANRDKFATKPVKPAKAAVKAA